MRSILPGMTSRRGECSRPLIDILLMEGAEGEGAVQQFVRKLNPRRTQKLVTHCLKDHFGSE